MKYLTAVGNFNRIYQARGAMALWLELFLVEPEDLIDIFFISRDIKGVWRQRSMKFLTSTEFKTGLKTTV